MDGPLRAAGLRVVASLVAVACLFGLTVGPGARLPGAAASFLVTLPVVKGFVPQQPASTPTPTRSLAIAGVTDNSATYPNGQVPRYEKLEITFKVANTVASNLFFPYDESPPPGVSPRIGISVDAQLSQDGFQTVYTQPAFYYQDFVHETRGNRDWVYPKDSFSWKVRFAPPREGTWQYRLVARDASGMTTSQPRSFAVTGSTSNGFIRAASHDPRYFEFEDGTYFPSLGYNMNFDHVSWSNPILDNQANFGKMKANGIQLVRVWLSQWSIFGSQGNPWRSPIRGSDYDSLTATESDRIHPGSDTAMFLKWSNDLAVWQGNPCMFLGWMKASPAVKPNTSYHVRIRYLIPAALPGPSVAGQPYGLVAKLGGWLTGSRIGPNTTWRKGQECAYPASLANAYNPGLMVRPVTPYASAATSGWSTLEGDFVTDAATTGGGDFLPYLYLALENVTSASQGEDPSAYIDYVEVMESLPGGGYGPNVVSKPWMSHLQYVDQRYSFAFDEVLDLARQDDVYFKLVVLEKSEFTQNSIDYDGRSVAYDSSNRYFYGNWRNLTKVRWLQRAWWRYLQARWGYSTNIHSWELLNEGDPYNGLHWTLADEFGKYMHQFAANSHLVTTSFWNGFPRDQFWANSSYPDVDYADVHQYVQKDKDPASFYDSALASASLSAQVGARTPGGANKPTVRGETGFVDSGTDSPTSLLARDTQGIWLHKFLWAGLNPGGLIELYWYDSPHIYGPGFDHRDAFGAFYRFVKDIPLNNGRYEDVQASVSGGSLRVWGQKDRVGGRAHLWIDNATHTWGNVVENPSAVVLQSGTVRFTGMPEGRYTIQWFDTYSGRVSATESRVVDASGAVALGVDGLATDVAVKVERAP